MMNEIILKEMNLCNRNFISKRWYRGLSNQRKLEEAGYATPERLTFNQAKKNGLKIKAGSKGIVIKHNELIDLKEIAKDGSIEIKKIPQVKSWLVFNVEQTEPVKVS